MLEEFSDRKNITDIVLDLLPEVARDQLCPHGH